MDFIRIITVGFLLLVLNVSYDPGDKLKLHLVNSWLFSQVLEVKSEYELFVRFYSLRNPSGFLPEGRCCDSIATSGCSIIQNLCDLRVYACQRPIETRVLRNFLFDMTSDCGPSSVSSSSERDMLQLQFNNSFLAIDNPILFREERLVSHVLCNC